MFSPVDFHVRMAELLIFLMITNAITGVVILPSFVSAFRPEFFIHRYVEENEAKERQGTAAPRIWLSDFYGAEGFAMSSSAPFFCSPQSPSATSRNVGCASPQMGRS